MNCRICDHKTKKVFSTKTMNKYTADYYFCPNCELLQVNDPHWLDEAYASPMNLTDVGVLRRNLRYGRIVGVMLLFLFGRDQKYLDFSGGYGIFTRLMRDWGFDYYWNDPYTKNLLARGFEYKEGDEIQALTSFEVFEHIVDIHGDFQKMVNISGNIIFSTQLTPDPLPDPSQWWYYGLEHGQHTALYRQKSLEVLGKQQGLKLYSNGADLHIFLESDVIPQLITGELLKLVMKHASKSQRAELLELYQPFTLSGAKSPLRKRYYDARYGKFYKLSQSVSNPQKETIQGLVRQAGVDQQLMHYLFSTAERIAPLFLPETWDYIVADMNKMKDVMLGR